MPGASTTYAPLINKLFGHIQLIVDEKISIENKLRSLQELADNLEAAATCSGYADFLVTLVPNFLSLLRDTEPQFIAELPSQQMRKQMLEIFHRLPNSDHLKTHVRNILSLMFKLIETDNEENVLICSRIIIDLHKQYRPQITSDVQQFLRFVKSIYADLAGNMPKIFEGPQVGANGEVSIESPGMATQMTITTTGPDGQQQTQTVIPKAQTSLKVLAELPLIVVLMYQLYKQNIYALVSDFIPLIMTTINQQPSLQMRNSPTFSKELYVDFIAAQIKTLSFLAYIVRIYHDTIKPQANHMVRGMLDLLANCPPEVAHLRKELLIASRHILATDLRSNFVPCITQLFKEKILIGTGWTSRETLRTLAYSTLADLIHHVKQMLPLQHLAMAVHLFCRNMHDDSLPASIQTMSCKLLLNLCESIKNQSETENGNGREILIRLLEMFVAKFEYIALYQLPNILKKCQLQAAAADKSSSLDQTALTLNTIDKANSSTSLPTTSAEPSDSLGEFDKKEEESPNKVRSTGSSCLYSVPDCRTLVKTLVCGVKTITWSIKIPGELPATSKFFHPKEVSIFKKLIIHALKSLDIYMISITPQGVPIVRPSNSPTVRLKEEKEVLEHFAGVFTMMNMSIFREIFSVTIDYIVERIYENYALQIVANSFLATTATSATFATVLVDYLLVRLQDIGNGNSDRSNLYLKLFKLVFGSVSLFASENEQMLKNPDLVFFNFIKPHLHKIVNKCMELAQVAKDPINYFYLLRALFRSIGGGSHDQLYQEFLPLLCNLLNGLNILQSGLHRAQMRDLFVELCLTVPVRLSSLLPYLPLLMGPLVSALNGSPTLISQGLRTLELCVDNLQPDFLYDHIQPVRAELMQALWKTLRDNNDSVALVAFRVLGKFGGGNRKVLKEPQTLTYNNEEIGPCVTVKFIENSQNIELPVKRVIDNALQCLSNPSSDTYYRIQAYKVIQCYIKSSLNLDDNTVTLKDLFLSPEYRLDFTSCAIPAMRVSELYRCSNTVTRDVMKKALTACLLAAGVKELRNGSVIFMANIVRHFTLLAVCQQTGPFPASPSHLNRHRQMDVLVVVDAIASIIAHEEKDLCRVGEIALKVMLDTSATILGGLERACMLPLFEYATERMCSCCYDRAWYAKLGGCLAIRFLLDNMSYKWVLNHQFPFLKALLFVMMDLTGEVSNGAIDMAKECLGRMLRLCGDPQKCIDNEPLKELQQRSLNEVVRELVREVTSPNQIVREQAMHSMSVLSEILNQSITDIMTPHKEVLVDMIPPKKHLLRHQPANAQIGLMEGNTFCTTLEPRLFTFDMSLPEHKMFFSELTNLCETDDSQLSKLSCYKAIPSLVPLRLSALKALASCYYVPDYKDKIFQLLYKAVNSTDDDLQVPSEECFKKFIQGCGCDLRKDVYQAMRPLLMTLGDHKNLTLNVVARLTSLTRLFPFSFNEKFCDQMHGHLIKWLQDAANSKKTNSKIVPQLEVNVSAAIINIFHLIPSMTSKLIEPLVTATLQGEMHLSIELASPFRKPLSKFLALHPAATAQYFLSETPLRDEKHCSFFLYLLSVEEGASIVNELKQSDWWIETLSFSHPINLSDDTKKVENQMFALQIIHSLIEESHDWITDKYNLIETMYGLWKSEAFVERHCGDSLASCVKWFEPQLIVDCLVAHIRSNNFENVKLLISLLTAFSNRFVCNFISLRRMIDNDIVNNSNITLKRVLFFKFAALVDDSSFDQDWKARGMQYLITPMFQHAFEEGLINEVIGEAPNPESDSPENVVGKFVNELIDPDRVSNQSDYLRISFLQFASLLVEHAPTHIHQPHNKKQGSRLKRLMTYAWPCLLPKTCVDPSAKYHGHLLLSHIIAKFAIHKKIVLQVFYSLLKAYAVEARHVVRQALDILTPAMPTRMEDGNAMLAHWTKKIILEEGHTVQQLTHILQLIVKQYKIYYPVHTQLTHQILTSIQRLGFTTSATVEQKKLAVELVEVMIKWELQKIKEQANDSAEEIDAKRQRLEVNPTDSTSEKHKIDSVVNFLIRIACSVINLCNQTNPITPSGDMLSKKSVNLLKMVYKPGVWLKAELKLAWLDKLLLSTDQGNANLTNTATALDVLLFLFENMSNEVILQNIKVLQRGLTVCMANKNSKVLKALHALFTKIMTVFPPESSNAQVSSKHEELISLYSCVAKHICDGLTQYEKVPTATPHSLYGTVMLLKAACVKNASYIDSLLPPIIRTMQKLMRDHISPQPTSETSTSTTELITTLITLLKGRITLMNTETKKTFFSIILFTLIEKSSDPKMLKAIVKFVEECFHMSKAPHSMHQALSQREKTTLLYKLMQSIDKRFPDDVELNTEFLEIVSFVYSDSSVNFGELTAKLEQAFLSGLRSNQPKIRAKFFEIFDESIKKRLYERVLYISCSQNWETMQQHYWIKQCIHLFLAVADPNVSVLNSPTGSLLPKITSVLDLAIEDGNVRAERHKDMLDTLSDKTDSDFDEEEDSDGDLDKLSALGTEGSSDEKIIIMLKRHSRFVHRLRDQKTATYLNAVAQLCHNDSELSHWLWVELFPRVWKILTSRQQAAIGGEITPFLCSGSHLPQKECYPSVIYSMLEAFTKCVPSIYIRPCVLKYLGKSHNLWHRTTLQLEQLLIEDPTGSRLPEEEVMQPPADEIVDSLSDVYTLLNEEDMWAGLWQKRAKYPETVSAIAYEIQGLFTQAQRAYEAGMSKARDEPPISNPPPFSEFRLWETRWVRCAKELSEWDLLLEYGNSRGDHSNPFLVLDCAWRLPDWKLTKEALSMVESSCPRDWTWKLNLYRGFLCVCKPEELNVHRIERLVDCASGHVIKEWKRLPTIVSHVHIKLLQGAQQVVELQEASQIHQGLVPTSIGRASSLHDMKATVKTWRNRLPMISDDLSHWCDIFMWRQHHYQAIVTQYEAFQSNYNSEMNQQANHAMLGVHASAQAIIHYGKVARKHNLTGVCLDSLSRIHTIPSVPIIDCFHKIVQQVKCFLQMSNRTNRSELQEGLDVIESTNLKYFNKEMICDFYSLKGLFLQLLNRSEEANKAFSAAIQFNDSSIKAWAYWGDYLHQLFVKDRDISQAESALLCYLHASRHQQENKSRKYLAKVIWLLSYDENKVLAKTIDKYGSGMPSSQWIPWIPQMLTCLVRSEGQPILNLLSQVAKAYPQAVYFPLRTLYLTLKIEEKEKYNAAMKDPVQRQLLQQQQQQNEKGRLTSSLSVDSDSKSIETEPAILKRSESNVSAQDDSDSHSSDSAAKVQDGSSIRAPEPMWRCSRIMHLQRDHHPTLLSSLEGIVDQMMWFGEYWYEEVLRQLKQALSMCYSLAFESTLTLSETVISSSTLNFINKLVATFGVHSELPASTDTAFRRESINIACPTASMRDADVLSDPQLNKMKSQFTVDFDMSVPGADTLQNLINKLQKWIKILDAKVKLLPSFFLIEEKCRFLSNFSLSTAEVDIPGEFLMPKQINYYVRIARFLPRVEIVQKHNSAARRLYIRGNNGKIYPHLVVNDACMFEARRDERVLQLFRFLNHFLDRKKDTAKRFLQFTVPKVVGVSPQMRLVEDEPSSMSLSQICFERCTDHQIDDDTPITRYYERTAHLYPSPINHGLQETLADISRTLVPRTVLKEWALTSYSNATHYWTFRKQFTLHASLLALSEFVLHLTKLNPDMLQIIRESGFLSVFYFKFGIDDSTGELDANRAVPFRLTPNFVEFISEIGLSGVFAASMIAVARCFVEPRFAFDSYLRAVLRDEMIAWDKRKRDDVSTCYLTPAAEMDKESLVSSVDKAVNVIMTRLKNLSQLEGGEGKVTNLIAVASNPENLARMDPSWHPWL